MNDWNRPVSEYRGEFQWTYKEGFNREGRREKEADRLSADLRQLRLAKKREAKEQKETAVADSETFVDQTRNAAVIIDTHGDEYEVCETAKEALERLIKSDHRLASKYQNNVKKLNARLKPCGTSYQSSFMKSSNVFPSARAYEMAAEEFQKNQELFESSSWNSKSRGHASSEWETRLVNYGRALESIREETHDYSNQVLVELQQDEPGGNNETEHEDSELMRRKWVDTAHLELSRTFKGNPQATEELRERSKDIVPLWLRRSLQRRGLI